MNTNNHKSLGLERLFHQPRSTGYIHLTSFAHINTFPLQNTAFLILRIYASLIHQAQRGLSFG
jgi:hypothetical protein